MTTPLTLEQAYASMNQYAKDMLLAMARDFARDMPLEAIAKEPLRLTLVPQARKIDRKTDVLNSAIDDVPTALIR
jgi:hypothetical protein